MNRPACKTIELTIRPARSSAEIAEAADLYERAGRAAFTWRPPDYFRAADFTRFALEEDVWLAYFGQLVAGLISLYREERFVHSLYVDPEAQGLGIGRTLVERVRREVGGPMTLKVDGPNTAAIAFYERTGWRLATGGDDRGIDEFGITWLRYRLD